MKNSITLIFSILLLNVAFGQRLDYDNDSKWFWGFNLGGTWNTTDVKNKTNLGWGLTLGRAFNYNYGKKVSFDLRMRYLGGNWYGQDYDTTHVIGNTGYDPNGAVATTYDSLGYTVNNFQTEVHELGLELVIHANGLRERTGWDPYIFGGANIVWNQTYGDLYAQDTINYPFYNYAPSGISKAEWSEISDDIYDNPLDGTKQGYSIDFMPSLGFGLAYQVGPRFSIGLEHKTTFALKNTFDGYANEAMKWGAFENDIYHYSSLFLKFGIRKGTGKGSGTPDTRPDKTTGFTDGGGCQTPLIAFIRPRTNNFSTNETIFDFRATVNHVADRNSIRLFINGAESTNFTFDANGTLRSTIVLKPGNNLVSIQANNACGTSMEETTLILADCKAPVIQFTSPSALNSSTENQMFSVNALVQGADRVEYTVNGFPSTNFVFTPSTNSFVSNQALVKGVNTLKITAINACGTTEQSVQITYADCPPPIVNMGANGATITVDKPLYTLRGTIGNVSSRSELNLMVNGVSTSFTTNSTLTTIQSNVALRPGSNTIVLTATTACGTTSQTIVLNYKPCEMPALAFIAPAQASGVVQTNNYLLKAQLQGVNTIGQIVLKVNGSVVPGGTFTSANGLFQQTVTLQQGNNVVQLTATNECGTTQEMVVLTYNAPCSAPVVAVSNQNQGPFTVPSATVVASVFNVSNVGEITLTVNGQQVTGGSYSAATNTYQNTITLQPGGNTIQLLAVNGCGRDSELFTWVYEPCKIPVVTVLSPATQTMSTTNPTMLFKAKVDHVNTIHDLSFTVNGAAIGGGTYSAATKTFTATIALNPGLNTVVLKAVNNCGSDTKTWKVTKKAEVIVNPIDPIEEPVEEEKIVICHYPPGNTGNPQQLEIPLSAWPAHQAHGDKLGPCPAEEPVEEEKIVICHYPPGNTGNPQQLEIPLSAWPAHQAHGDKLGPCPAEEPVEEEKIVICHYPPGNTGNPQQMEIPLSAWPAHQAHGDKLGPCPAEEPVEEEKIVICHYPPGNTGNPQQLEIPLSAWPAHQAHGDKLGPCPAEEPVEEEKIVICHYPPGNTGNPQQLEIPLSAWPAHQAHGDKLGPCPAEEPVEEEKIVICHYPPGKTGNPQQLEIPLSAWPAHQAHGDKLGPCPAEEKPVKKDKPIVKEQPKDKPGTITRPPKETKPERPKEEKKLEKPKEKPVKPTRPSIENNRPEPKKEDKPKKDSLGRN